MIRVFNLRKIKEPLSHDLKNKFIYQLLIAGTQVLVPLLTYPLITRVLGPQNIGVINYIDFLAQVFAVFAAFGVPYYAVREIAALKDHPGKRSKLISEMALLNLFFSLLATAAFVLFTFKSWQQQPLLYLLATINIFLSAFSFEWYLQGTESFKFAAIRTVVVRTIMVACLYMFVREQQDYRNYFIIYTIAIFTMALLNLSKVLSENKLTWQHLNVKQHLHPLWHFFLTSSAISIYIYFDTIMLEHLTHNNEAVGYYSFTLKMVKVFLLVIVAVGTVLSPRLSYLVSSGLESEGNAYINKLLQFVLVAAIPAGAGMSLLAPEIIGAIAGNKFSPSVPLLRILAWLPLIIGLSNVFCFQTLVPFKQEKKFLGTVLTGCFVSICANLLLIPHFQEKGAAMASVITEITITIMSGYLASRLTKLTVQPSTIVSIVASCLLFIPVIVLARNLLTNHVLILVVTIPLCVMLYVIMLGHIFKNDIIIQVKKYFINLVVNKAVE